MRAGGVRARVGRGGVGVLVWRNFIISHAVQDSHKYSKYIGMVCMDRRRHEGSRIWIRWGRAGGGMYDHSCVANASGHIWYSRAVEELVRRSATVCVYHLNLV